MYRTSDDRVAMWATINEPWVIVDQGYVEGRHAPGRRDWAEAAAVSKNLLQAHAAAVDAYRAEGKHSIGLVVNLVPIHPATDTTPTGKRRSGWTPISTGSFSIRLLLGRESQRNGRDVGRRLASVDRGRAAAKSASRSISSASIITCDWWSATIRRPARRGPAAVPQAQLSAYRDGLGDLSQPGLRKPSQWVQRALRRFAAVHHGKWRRVRRSSAPKWRRRGHASG